MPKLGSHKSSLVFFLTALTAMSIGTACVSRGTIPQTVAHEPTADSTLRLNINTAGENDLEKLPHVGPALATKIVEFRRRYGPFRRIEHVMLVEGISDKRFREIRDFITTE